MTILLLRRNRSEVVMHMTHFIYCDKTQIKKYKHKFRFIFFLPWFLLFNNSNIVPLKILIL